MLITKIIFKKKTFYKLEWVKNNLLKQCLFKKKINTKVIFVWKMQFEVALMKTFIAVAFSVRLLLKALIPSMTDGTQCWIFKRTVLTYWISFFLSESKIWKTKFLFLTESKIWDIKFGSITKLAFISLFNCYFHILLFVYINFNRYCFIT